jgi:hypothetical protein
MNTTIRTLSADEIELVAGGYNFGPSSTTNVSEYLNIQKSLTSVVATFGNFAGAEAGATATGLFGTATQAISATATTAISSASSATSVSGSGGYLN